MLASLLPIPLVYVSTSRVLPSNGPGDGSAASISRFVICSHCDDTDIVAEVDGRLSGVGAGHVLVLITIFSGRSLPLPDVDGADVDDDVAHDADAVDVFRCGFACCAANLASDNGVRCG